ncbi:Peptidase C19, ubiquitin carboxyl-terminal hydrolase 2 [Corchorus capsularis]|uniref:Peptidase C19, ubiquitin carboxyl-terminal hydrolase 2 n=1 Tax=Corchorus capsularis TaxID=210143 RepID=A0A1R3IRG5_COCAP|nr:Peptidase C19, ubiquitin carboxyl-terminal hydrolase 2 [Corchorus capsularis]
MIPKELIFEIFLRLPGKDLVRFRCLSKEICQEIHSSAFNLNRSKKAKTHRKLFVYDKSDVEDKRGLYVADVDEEDEVSKLPNPLNPDGCLIRDGFDVYGSCSGLLLLYNNKTRKVYDVDEVYSWLLLNPFTRKFTKVIACPGESEILEYCQTLFGFGYDSIRNDYKLVQIFRPYNWKENHDDVQIWVFSFASNTWRKLTVPFCHNKTFPLGHDQIGVFADGALHWLCEGINHEIVTFDISNEVFVNLFHPLRRPICIGFLLVIGGSQTLLRRGFYKLNDVELYLAVKCGEHYNWTKLHNINLELCPSSILTPTILTVMKRSNNEILVPFSDTVAQRGFGGEIDSAAFTLAHLNRSKKTETHRKLVVYHNNGYSKDDNGLYVADFDNENEISLFGNPLNPDGCFFMDGFDVYGSCNEINRDNGTRTVTTTHEIVTFDVSKEVFVNLVHSDSLSPSPLIGKAYLLVIGGSLALLRDLNSNEPLELYLAVKCEEHYYTWTKVYNISSLELRHSCIFTSRVLRAMERSNNEISVPFKDIVAQRDFGGDGAYHLSEPLPEEQQLTRLLPSIPICSISVGSPVFLVGSPVFVWSVCQGIRRAAFVMAYLNRPKKAQLTHGKVVVHKDGDKSGLYVANEDEITTVYDGDEVYYRWLLLNPLIRKFKKLFACLRIEAEAEGTVDLGNGSKASSSSPFDDWDVWENGLDPVVSLRISFGKIGTGLMNLGNTCYLNSVLQCLTYTEPLVTYLESGRHRNSCRSAGFCALCAIEKHVSRALELTGTPLAPRDLVSNLRCISRNLRNSRQEDAHEYMVNLLESMHNCCLTSGESPSSSFVDKIFGGRLRSQVKCTHCHSCSNKFDPFLDLSLEIVKANSLRKALKNFTAAELLDGGERQYQCEGCKQKVKAIKQLMISKAPHVLIFHLKRFRAHDFGQKIDRKIKFGSTLDMKPFVSGSNEEEGDNLKYSLYGVLVHYGRSTYSGHYYCFVRMSSGMWYSLDDHRVVQVSEKTVLDQKAYMLFYHRLRLLQER